MTFDELEIIEKSLNITIEQIIDDIESANFPSKKLNKKLKNIQEVRNKIRKMRYEDNEL